MSDITKKYNVYAKGIFNIESDGQMSISIEDVGDISLNKIFDGFNGKEIKIAVEVDDNIE